MPHAKYLGQGSKVAATAQVSARDRADAEREYRVARKLLADGSDEARAALRRVAALDPGGALADDALVDLALSDDEQYGHFFDAVLANFVRNLFVPGVSFGAKVGVPQCADDFLGVGVCVGRNRQHLHLRR